MSSPGFRFCHKPDFTKDFGMYEWILDNLFNFVLRKQIAMNEKRRQTEMKRTADHDERLAIADLNIDCDAFGFLVKIGFTEQEAGERLKGVKAK
jgi:hypothetical protein